MYIPEMYYHLSPDELRDKISDLEDQLHEEQDKSIVMADAIHSALEFIDELPWERQMPSLITKLKKALKVAEEE